MKYSVVISVFLLFALLNPVFPKAAYSAGPPSSALTSPSGGSTLHGKAVTITGTARDNSGSGLQKVEISINGSPWATASGTTAWSYNWSLPADGVYTIRSRSADKLGGVESPGQGIAVTVDNCGTPELQHYLWSPSVDAQGCGSCHTSPSFLPQDYDKTNGFCASCHNASGIGHDRPIGGRQHPTMVNCSTAWTKRPGYGNVTTAENDNRPFANLQGGRLITCATCHNAMNKYEDVGRTWEYTTTTDRLVYYLQRGGWGHAGVLRPLVYRDTSLWIGPTYSRDRKDYLVDPGEYTYDETSGTLTFAVPQPDPTYIYVTLDYPYLRVSSRDNNLCQDCHTEATHKGNNCLTCHQAHNTGNISGIKEVIRTTDLSERQVKFINISGPNSFADGNTTYDGVCEVCHTQTLYCRRDGSGARTHADGRDYSRKDCTKCHTHQSGFARNPSATPPLPLIADSLTPSLANATAGEVVTWLASASGGTGSLQYQFLRNGPDTAGSYVLERDWGSSNLWAWRTSAAAVGGNIVKVNVRNSNGSGSVSYREYLVYTLSAASSTGSSYYMATTGSDSNTGSISSPWKTIKYASARLKPGDTLYVRGGTYTGQGGYIWNSVSGTPTAPITMKAYPGEKPVFDGGWTLGEWMVLTNSVGWIVIDGITAEHFDDAYGNGTILIINGANNITIQNCWIHDNGKTASQDHDIYVGAPGVANITIRNNLLQNTPGGGIHCWHGPSVNGLFIYNNIITGCKWGIIAGDGAQNIEIYNNTIDKNSIGIHFYYDGQDVKTGVQTATIKNNIISNCSYGMQVASFNVNDVTSDYNLWYNNSVTVLWNTSSYTLAQYQANTASEDHAVGADPSYVSASTGNYRLNSTSPAANKGTALGKVPNDKDYVARPRGAAYDIGAYESY